MQKVELSEKNRMNKENRRKYDEKVAFFSWIAAQRNF
jgi:hypothetical protein